MGFDAPARSFGRREEKREEPVPVAVIPPLVLPPVQVPLVLVVDADALAKASMRIQEMVSAAVLDGVAQALGQVEDVSDEVAAELVSQGG